MNLTKFNESVSNVQNLADVPTQGADELKQVFDKAGADIQTYINTILTEEIEKQVNEELTKMSETLNNFETKLNDSGWIPLDIKSEFEAYSGGEENIPKYRIIGNIVHIKGVLTPTKDILGNNTSVEMFSVPKEIAPKNSVYCVCQGSTNYRWLAVVTTSGAVTFSRYANSSTPATCKPGNWLPFNVTYFIG